MLDRDRISLANPDRIGQAALAALSGVQVQFSPEEQTMGIALALSALVEHHKVHGGTVLDACDRLKNHFGDHPEVRATSMYVENEL